MREKLKPCPCCGREKPMEFIQDSSLIIHCHGCALEIRRALVPPSEWEKAAVACREAWNRRANEPIH